MHCHTHTQLGDDVNGGQLGMQQVRVHARCTTRRTPQRSHAHTHTHTHTCVRTQGVTDSIAASAIAHIQRQDPYITAEEMGGVVNRMAQHVAMMNLV
jgi:hypothetical protein